MNIFIGKNNSGKSNIFEAIKTFRSIGTVINIENLFYDKDRKDPKNIIKIRVTFELLEDERERILTELFPEGTYINKKDVLNTSFFKTIRYETAIIPPENMSSMGADVFLDRVLVNNLDGTDFAVFWISEDRRTCTYVDLIKSCKNLASIKKNITSGSETSTNYALPHMRKGKTSIIPIDLLSEFISDDRNTSDDLCKFFALNPHRRSDTSQKAFGSLKDGRDLPRVLTTLYSNHRDIYEKMAATLKTMIPEMENLITRLEGETTTPKIKEKNLKSSFDMNNLGSGVGELLILITLIFVVDKGGFICIEEPEIHHHASTQRKFFNFLKEESKNKQFFIATHSSIFTDKAEANSTYIVKKDKGQTDVVKVASEDFDKNCNRAGN